ncbi:MAG: Fe-S cluster assembly protein SufD [Candidatus Puniceispirillaceae bacterium]
MQPDNLRQTSQICQQAKAQFDARGLPSAKDEAWIYTRLADVTISPSEPQSAAADTSPATLIFSAGWLVSGGDNLPAGVSLTVIDSETKAFCDAASLLPDDHMLRDLGLGHITGAYLIEIADGAVIDTPITLQFTDGVQTSSSHPFVIVRMGENSQFQMAEMHHGNAALSAPVMVFDIAASAKLDHIKLQNDSLDSHHLALSVMAVAEQADINSFTLAYGGALGRHETHIHLNGEHAQTALSAIYLGRGQQHQDVTSRMLHLVPNCQSSQIIRGVLDDEARGVFQGKVLVAKDAQKTDGQQMSRALLLSRKAEADAKPELEIFADDVVCSHGATVGEIDETHLFYLKSRGIAEADARNMLIEAFLLDGVESVRDEHLAAILRNAIAAWMTEAARG